MILVEEIVGNISEPVWQNELKDYEFDLLTLEQWEASKSRLKKYSTKGYEIALSLPRNCHLNDQDILYLDQNKKIAVISQISLQEVMLIRLSTEHQGDFHQRCFTLGHALGNQHWPAVFKNNIVYVPFYLDKKIMLSVIKTHGFNEVEIDFVSGDSIKGQLSNSEMRLLFSNGEHSHHF